MDTETIWTPERIEQAKREIGISEAFVCRHHGCDALGFERDGTFWIAKGSRLAPITELLEGCWEYKYRVEASDDGYFQAHIAMRHENLLTKESAARVVTSDATATESLWLPC